VPAAVKTLFDSATNGGRISRNGDLVVVTLNALAFITTAQEFQMAAQWGRSKQSNGIVHRDVMALVERLETVIARNGSGVATRGNPKALQRMVLAMTQLAIPLDDWAVPLALAEEGMQVKKKPAAVVVEAEPESEVKPEADA
jgi:hypothetical protein